MVVIERSPGEGVQIGHHVLRVLAVHADEVVVALLDPDKVCVVCGAGLDEPAQTAGATEPGRCPRCAPPPT
jgi:hypothetical protein